MKSLGPAFQFYVDDFIGGTMGMSAADIGAYLLMLCHQWNAGSVPSKSRELGQITRRKPSQLGPVLAKFCHDENGNYVNIRMAQLRAERITYLNNQAAAGKASADKRRPTTVQPPLQPPLQPEGQPEGKSPSPSPSPEDSIPTPYSRLCACLPEGMNPPTIETVTAWARAYGIAMADHEDIIAADLRSTPPNLWAKDGLLRVKYAIANAADRHQRMGATPRISQREQDMQAARRAAEESGF